MNRLIASVLLLWLVVGSPCLLPSQTPHLSVANSHAPSKVLFVCEHGAALSIVSAAYFNKIAREEHLPFQAISWNQSSEGNRRKCAPRFDSRRRSL